MHIFSIRVNKMTFRDMEEIETNDFVCSRVFHYITLL